MGAYTSLFEVDHFVSGISRKIGLSFSASGNAVASAVGRVMARRGIEHAEHLLDQIGLDQSLADEIVMEIKGAETYFFRAPAQFDVIRNTTLPVCSRRSGGGSPIRIWSAGYATEPYSLAILLQEEGLADNARITATDISRRALMKAKVAEYSAWSLRSTDDRLAAQFLLGLCLRDGSPLGALHAFENALSLCASRPPREPVPLMPAEVAGHLAARSRLKVADLERSLAGYSR